MNLLVTGGCGFIGSNYIKEVIDNPKINKLVNLDALTYAGSRSNTEEFEEHEKYWFEHVDLTDIDAVRHVYTMHNITHVVHFAAESHVDNSINGPRPFIETNIGGTFNLLEVARAVGVKKFHHISTDEVFGHLSRRGFFKETTPYSPRNPYAASKASADMIVQSYNTTFELPTVISNCCNNYGPKQHKEKLIPVIIENLINEKPIPVYGDGSNIRDWIYVVDHCKALWRVMESGKVGQSYNIGARCEKTNLTVIFEICKVLKKDPMKYIKYVKDRAGHDFRYAIDNKKVVTELNWTPEFNFKQGIKETVNWYVENREQIFA